MVKKILIIALFLVIPFFVRSSTIILAATTDSTTQVEENPIPWFQFWSNLWRSRGDRFSNLKTEIRAWFVKEQPISCLPKPYLKNYDVKNQDANTRAQASSTQNYHKGTYLKSIIDGRYSDSIIAYFCEGICTNTPTNDSCTEIRFSTLVYYFYKNGEKILYDKDNYNNPVDYNPIKMESYKYTLPENSDLYFRNLYNNISQIPKGSYQEEKDIAGISSRELNHSLRTFLPASSQSPTPVRSVFTQKGIEDMIDDNDVQQQAVFSNFIPYQNLIGVIGRYSKSKTLGETDEVNPTDVTGNQIGEENNCFSEDNLPTDCYCAANSQCISGLCKDGRCTATDECSSVNQRPVNCDCNTNFQCDSKNCSVNKCIPAPDCSSDSNRPLDCQCSRNNQCTSGVCKDRQCIATKFDTLREMFKDNLHPYTWQFDLDGLPEREDDTGLCTAKSSHCHGLSQFGALGMALAGANYETILRSYYGNIRLVNLRDIAGPNHLYVEVSNENCDACVKLKPNGSCDTETTSRMYIEDYLRGLGEMYDYWGSTEMGGMAAIEAQVIAARTYAYVRTLGFSRPICTTAACQVFRCKIVNAKPNHDIAIKKTAYLVMVDAVSGRPFSSQYARSFCGPSIPATYHNDIGGISSSHTTPAFDTKLFEESAFEQTNHPPNSYCK